MLTLVSMWRWVAVAHDPDIPKSVTDSRPADGEFGDWQLRRAAHFAWRLGDFKSKLDRYVRVSSLRIRTRLTLTHAGRVVLGKRFFQTRLEQVRSACINIRGKKRRNTLSSPPSVFVLKLPGRWMRRFCYSCFGVTRIPKPDSDELVNIAHPHPSRHVVVLVRDQVFRLELFDHRNDRLRDVEELEASLRGIVEEVEKGDLLDLPVGVLTGSDRDHWAEVRTHTPTTSF
jgi:hypothetical protein